MKSIFLALALITTSAVSAQTTDSTKNEPIVQTTNTDSVYSKVEVNAAFPGGLKNWIRHVEKELNSHNLELKKYKNAGACEIQFKVNREGIISDVFALTLAETELAQVMVSFIKNGARWIPAIQNGIQVSSWRKVSISFPLENSIY